MLPAQVGSEDCAARQRRCDESAVVDRDARSLCRGRCRYGSQAICGDDAWLGTVGRQFISGQGRATILTLGPTEIFGWSAVTPVVGTRLAAARAVIPTQAIEFDSQALRRVCDEDHDLGYYVYRRLTNVMAGRLSATRLQLIDMYASSRE